MYKGSHMLWAQSPRIQVFGNFVFIQYLWMQTSMQYQSQHQQLPRNQSLPRATGFNCSKVRALVCMCSGWT